MKRSPGRRRAPKPGPTRRRTRVARRGGRRRPRRPGRAGPPSRGQVSRPASRRRPDPRPEREPSTRSADRASEPRQASKAGSGSRTSPAMAVARPGRRPAADRPRREVDRHGGGNGCGGNEDALPKAPRLETHKAAARAASSTYPTPGRAERSNAGAMAKTTEPMLERPNIQAATREDMS